VIVQFAVDFGFFQVSKPVLNLS